MRTFILAAFILIETLCFGQEEKPESTIKATGRYTIEKGIEIRFFPEKKDVLYIGLKNGFIIERKLVNESDFKQIAIVKAFTLTEWDTVIESTKDQESKENLELAKDFYIGINNKKGGDIGFDEGILKLKEQKGIEDFELLIFVLTAIKDKAVAEGLGLSYVDTKINQGETYVYRVKVNGQSKIYNVISEPYQLKASIKPDRHENTVYTKVGDTQLSFTWDETDELTGYYIERATPGEANFIQLNEAPIYTLTSKGYEGIKRSSYTDENLINYKTYTYRFYGTSAFGERVRFAEVKAMPRDLTPPQQPFLKQPKHIKPNEVLVTWEMTGKEEPDLKGFAISRSTNNQGTFKIIHENLLPKETRNFIDRSFNKNETNYYLVQAIDTANNVSSSFPVTVTLIDSIPPAKPKFILGRVDSLGVVTLEIELNKEPDLNGYRLFKANSDEHEFSVIREGFTDSDSTHKPVQLIYYDTVTLNSLSPYIYYRLKALDYNYNQSEFSEILKVKRPDTLAPTTPVFKKVLVRQNEVELHFALSESEDVIEHILYRKMSIDSQWISLAKIEPQQSSYIDKKVKQDTIYYYSLRAKDDSNLFSKFANPVYGKPFDNGVRLAVEKINIAQKKSNVFLLWEYKDYKEGTFFVIYKKNKKGNLKQYDRTSNLSYEDTKTVIGEQSYAVKVFTSDGGQSVISKVVSLGVKK